VGCQEDFRPNDTMLPPLILSKWSVRGPNMLVDGVDLTVNVRLWLGRIPAVARFTREQERS